VPGWLWFAASQPASEEKDLSRPFPVRAIISLPSSSGSISVHTTRSLVPFPLESERTLIIRCFDSFFFTRTGIHCAGKTL